MREAGRKVGTQVGCPQTSKGGSAFEEEDGRLPSVGRITHFCFMASTLLTAERGALGSGAIPSHLCTRISIDTHNPPEPG